ncbi:MAG: hypothetical protein AB1716_14370, partial [Planctomycetota bacterium]
MKRPPFSRLPHAELAAAAAVAVLTIALGSAVVRAPSMVGTYRDDGIYLATSRALAEGQSYRHAELPGEPLETKYPPLFPALLALLWRIAPRFPDNVALMQIANTALWGLGCWLSYRLMRRAWDLPGWAALGGTIIALLSPAAAMLLITPMSEPLYTVLASAALLVAARADSPHRTGKAGDAATGAASGGRGETADSARAAAAGRPALVYAAVAGALAGAAYLTRSVGLAVLVAVPLAILLRRRARPALAACASGGMAASAWVIWRTVASARNAANPLIAAFRYDLDYSAWTPATPAALAWVALHNAPALVLTLAALTLPLPGPWLDHTLAAGPTAAAPLYAGMAALAACVLIGAAASWQRRRAEVHLYLLAYCALLLAWPFWALRLLVPILPLLAALSLYGLFLIIKRIAGAIPARSVTVLFAFALAGCHGLQVFAPGPAYLAQATAAHRAREDLAAMIRTQTPPDALIAANEGAYWHLVTGRKFVPLLAFEDVV